MAQKFLSKIDASDGIQFTGGTIAQATTVLHTNNIVYNIGGSNGIILSNADYSDRYYITNTDHRWEVGGADKMRLDANQLLIGATSSSMSNDKLYINGDGYTTGGWRTGTSATYVGKLTNSSGILTLQSDTNRDIQLGDAGTPAIMYIDTSTEKIGIGTTSPAYKLDVNGGAIFLDSDWPLYLGSTDAFIEGNSSGTIVRINAAGGFKVTDGGATRLTIDTNGAATFGGSLTSDTFSTSNAATFGGDVRLQTDLSVLNKAQSAYIDIATRDTTGSEAVYNLSNLGTITSGGITVNGAHINVDAGYSFQWDDSHERIEQSDGKIEFFTNNTEQMTLSGSQLGIGTTTPYAKLDVDVGDASGMGASFAGGISAGEYQGIHFGYSENGNSQYRKSALVFERQDNSARGKIHILNNAQAGSNSAALADSRVTIQYDGKVGVGVTSPTQQLHVDGHTLISAEKYYYVAGTGGGIGSDASGNLILRQNDANLMTTSGSNVVFHGDITSGNIRIDKSTNPNIQLYRTSSTTQLWDIAIDSSGRLLFREAASSGGTKYTRFQIDDTGESTFFGSVHLDSDSAQLQFGDDNDMQIFHNGANGEINIGTGNFTIDAAGDIKLDADGGDWYFQDGGVNILVLTAGGSSSPTFAASQLDADIIFTGNDGGSTITALTLDMSDAGWAHFNTGISVGNTSAISTFAGKLYVGQTSDYFGAATNIQLNSGASNKFVGIRSNTLYLYSHGNGSDSALVFGDGSANFSLVSSDTDFNLYNYGTSSNSLTILRSNHAATFAGHVNAALGFRMASGQAIDFIDSNIGYNSIERNTSVGGLQINTGDSASINILDNGKVGIGTNDPGYKLEISEDTDGTVNLLMLRNSDSTYAQTWGFQSDTNKDLVITGSSGAGGFKFVPGSRGSTFTGDVSVGGNLTVTGTTTTVNQTNLDVSDNIIGLNRGASTNSNDSGIIIERGSTGDNAAFLWDESAGRFMFGTTTSTPSATGNVSITRAPIDAKGFWTTSSAIAHWGPYDGGGTYGTLTWDTGYALIQASGSNTLKLGGHGDANDIILDDTLITISKATKFTNTVSITADGSNAVTLAESGSGDFTIDAPDDIRLDAGGGDIVLRDDAHEYGRLSNNSGSGLILKSSAADKSIYIQPNGTGNVYCETDTLIVTAAEGEAAKFLLRADEADDNGDDWYINNPTTNILEFTNNKSGSQVAQFWLTPHATITSSQATFGGQLETQSIFSVRDASSNHQVKIQATVGGTSRIMAHNTNIGTNHDLDIVSTQIDFLTGSISGSDNSRALFLDSSRNATFTGTIASGNINISDGTPVLTLTDTSSSATVTHTLDGVNYQIANNGSSGNFKLSRKVGTTERVFLHAHDNGNLILYGSGSTAQTISGANTTFAGDITVTGGDITIGTDSIAGNINSVGDVLALNVDSNTGGGAGANIQLKTAGTTQLTVTSSSAAFVGNVTLADNKELIFGAATDYKIYHNSTTNVNHVSSLLDRQLSINANIIQLTNQANNSTYLLLNSSGATFAGAINLDQSHINIDGNGAVIFDNTNNNNAWYIRNGGSNAATLQFGLGTPGANIKHTFAGDGSSTFGGNITLDDGSGASPSVVFKNGSDDSGGISINSSGKIEIQTGGTIRQIISSGDTTFSANILGSATDFKIGATTSDGSDNQQLKIMGGGDATDTRGASIHLAGNEHGNTGLLQLRAGDGSGGGIRLYEGGSERMRITAGKVGIGTGSPTATLQVVGTTANTVTIDGRASGSYSHGNIYFTSGDSAGSWNAYRLKYVKDGSNDRLEFIDGSGSPNIYFNNGGSAYFASDVTINGDLNITGDINSTSVTNLDVDDKTITIAKGAADSAAADGAGLVVDGASASLLYDHTGTQWEFNKPVEFKDSGIIIDSIGGPYGRIHGTSSIFLGGGSTTQVQLSAALIPDADSTRSLGSSSRYWSHGYMDAITTTGGVTVGGSLSAGACSFGTLNITDDIYHVSDTNTYFGFGGGADTFQIVTAGTSALTIDSSQDITCTGDVQAAGLYVGSTNTSYDFYNNGTTYLNGTVTIDAIINQTGGAESTFSGNLRLPSAGKLYTWTGHDDNYLKYDIWRASASAGMTIENISANGEIYLKSGNALALTLDENQTATFASKVTSGNSTHGRTLNGSKSVTIADNTYTDVLTVTLASHTACYVKIFVAGDWNSHSSVQYLGEYFLTNGAGGYNEPGMIIREVDNTNTDTIVAKLVDPAGNSGNRDFKIQLLGNDTINSNSFSAKVTYEVMGQYISVS